MPESGTNVAADPADIFSLTLAKEWQRGTAQWALTSARLVLLKWRHFENCDIFAYFSLRE